MYGMLPENKKNLAAQWQQITAFRINYTCFTKIIYLMLVLTFNWYVETALCFISWGIYRHVIHRGGAKGEHSAWILGTHKANWTWVVGGGRLGPRHVGGLVGAQVGGHGQVRRTVLDIWKLSIWWRYQNRGNMIYNTECVGKRLNWMNLQMVQDGEKCVRF